MDVLDNFIIREWLILDKVFPRSFWRFAAYRSLENMDLLEGNLFALVLRTFTVIFSAILRTNILYQPNSLTIICSTLFYFTTAQYIDAKNRMWLLKAGIVSDFGCLNKYNLVILLRSILPAILITVHHKIFFTK